jgi:hypothetical protein
MVSDASHHHTAHAPHFQHPSRLSHALRAYRRSRDRQASHPRKGLRDVNTQTKQSTGVTAKTTCHRQIETIWFRRNSRQRSTA